MSTSSKCGKAIKTIRPDSFFVIYGKIESEADFNNNVKWETGIDEDNNAILTDTNPYSELTWTKVNAEMQRIQTEYDSQDYARKRKAEYPTVQELVVALYDTDDKAAIEAKRAEIKLKYPKPQ